MKNKGIPPFISIIFLFFIPIIPQCRVKETKIGNEITGKVTINRKEAPNTLIYNMTKKAGTLTNSRGEFKITVDDQDIILIEKELYGKIFTGEEIKREKGEIELPPLIKKVIYFSNFETPTFLGDVFILIPETKFLSPVLSDGRAILIYPDGTEYMMVITKNAYAKLDVSSIEDFEFVDMKNLKSVTLPESVKVFNSGDMPATLIRQNRANELFVEYGQNINSISPLTIYPGNITDITPGVYNIIWGENEPGKETGNEARKVIYNFLISSDTELYGGYPSPQDVLIRVEGTAKTSMGEPGVMVWAEGYGIRMERSTPLFRLEIPNYVKRIWFYKFGWSPVSIGETQNQSQNLANVQIELPSLAYVKGNVVTSGQYFVRSKKMKEDDDSEENIYFMKNTEIVLTLPQGESYVITITGDGKIPKTIEIELYNSSFLDLGEIYLCEKQDEECIIKEGIKQLRHRLYWIARETLKYTNSAKGKIALLITDMNIISKNAEFLSLRKNNTLDEIYNEIEEILAEIENTEEKLCLDRVPIDIIFISFDIPGCVGKTTIKLIQVLYKMLKGIRTYIYGHHLPENGITLELEEIRKMSLKSGELEFLEGFDPKVVQKQLEDALSSLLYLIQTATSCDETDEPICERNGKISLRMSNSLFFYIIPKNANVEGAIKSLRGEYLLTTTDIVSFLPGSGLDTNIPIPDFIRLDLWKLIQNPIRKIFPISLTYNGEEFMAIEIEIPPGFAKRDMLDMYPPLFLEGDTPHFKYGLMPLIEKDGIYPESSTPEYFDIGSQEFIIYVLLQDPSLGGAILLKPCELALTDEIYGRWCSGANSRYSFSPPTNQMLNDVLAVLQKYVLPLKLSSILIITP